MTPRWLSWMRFLRLPNALTVPGDVLAGAALAGTVLSTRALLATVLAYLFGMALNDCVDLPRDRQFRPERPLPSGAISLSAARIVCAALAIAALCLARFSAPLLLAIVAYTLLKDRLPVGPFLMGLCRALSLLMGAWAHPGEPAVLLAAGLWFFYVALFTHISEREDLPQSGGRLPWLIPLLLPAGLLPLAFLRLPADLLSLIAFALYLSLLLLLSLQRATTIRTRGQVLPADIGAYIALLFPLQAAVLSLCGLAEVAAIPLLFWLLFRWGGRRIRAS